MGVPRIRMTMVIMDILDVLTSSPPDDPAWGLRLCDQTGHGSGTIYPALVRLEQHGWTRASWARTENNREAKFYAITRAGLKALDEETARWRQMSGVVEKLLAEEQ